jgi:hypothetical protein
VTTRLLDRQIRLLEFLTSAEAIFARQGTAPLDQSLQGIDGGLLHLEAHFSHEKRMEKIIGVFPRTFEILSEARTAIIREFTEACPPVDISRLANARQFHDFLHTRWRHTPPKPAHLPDVLTCEFAVANARAAVERTRDTVGGHTSRRHIRRASGVVLLRCQHDVRPIFEEGVEASVPEQRDTPVAVVISPGSPHPRVFELSPAAFDLLSCLDEWGNPDTLTATPDLHCLIHSLAEHGLLEVGA